MDGLPFFDFNNPWVSLIQLALVFFLPRLVGWVTDRYAEGWKKAVLLGVLALAGSVLTFLLDVAVANAWATLDWIALLNLIINFVITWAAANATYLGFLSKLPSTERSQAGGLHLFAPRHRASI